ncbi:MAG: hypothetical protein O8C58_01115 [Candidatus Methanoperedens sp.]|nr:hypothetical protein [Candidatus Methanoperedens sp.]
MLLENLTEGEIKTVQVLREKYNFSDERISRMLRANRAANKDKAIEDEKNKNIPTPKKVKTRTDKNEYGDWLAQKEEDEESF